MKKQKKIKNIPTFKTDQGKYIFERKYVELLTNAVYRDQTKITIDGINIEILSSDRNEESWIVIIKTDLKIKG